MGNWREDQTVVVMARVPGGRDWFYCRGGVSLRRSGWLDGEGDESSRLVTQS